MWVTTILCSAVVFLKLILKLYWITFFLLLSFYQWQKIWEVLLTAQQILFHLNYKFNWDKVTSNFIYLALQILEITVYLPLIYPGSAATRAWASSNSVQFEAKLFCSNSFFLSRWFSGLPFWIISLKIF